jgi:phage major head subunit gpT-like protein
MVKGMSLVALQTLFRKEYNTAVGQYENTNAWDAMADIGTMIPSNGSAEDYRWLQESPEFEQWIGDLNSADLAEYKFAIVNEPFAASIGIHEDEIEDDKDDLILSRVRSMAGGDRRKWGKMLHDLLVNGTTGKAFDGIAFFSDATGARLNDNLLAGTISAATPTAAQVLADVDTVIQAMGAFKNSRGEIVGIVPDTFVVSLKCASVFRRALMSPTDASNANSAVMNAFSGMNFRIVVDPGLTDANDFYALATRYAVGGLVKQVRTGVEARLDETGRNKNGRLNFLAKFRGNVGYGLPIMACKVVSGAA